MYPFFVLDLPHEATDENVKDRYLELVKRYPPDTHPKQFAAVRQAYEAVRHQRGRLETRLFYFDKAARWEVESLPNTSRQSPTRRRFSMSELADYLRRTHD